MLAIKKETNLSIDFSFVSISVSEFSFNSQEAESISSECGKQHPSVLVVLVATLGHPLDMLDMPLIKNVWKMY